MWNNSLMEINWIEKLEEFRANSDLKKADMARIFGVDLQRYNNWVYRNSLPKSFYEKARITIERQKSRVNLIAEPNTQYEDRGTIRIPKLDVAASMGNGLTLPSDYSEVIEILAINEEYLRSAVAFSNRDNLAMITGYGDSMQGTYNDGDLLLVDRGVTEIKIDAVYVLCLDGELYIKRIQRRPDGTLLMLSDNKNYPPYEIKNGELATFQVLARVLLVWNAKRL